MTNWFVDTQKYTAYRITCCMKCDQESIEHLKINKAVSQKSAKLGLNCKIIPDWSIFQGETKK